MTPLTLELSPYSQHLLWLLTGFHEERPNQHIEIAQHDDYTLVKLPQTLSIKAVQSYFPELCTAHLLQMNGKVIPANKYERTRTHAIFDVRAPEEHVSITLQKELHFHTPWQPLFQELEDWHKDIQDSGLGSRHTDELGNLHAIFRRPKPMITHNELEYSVPNYNSHLAHHPHLQIDTEYREGRITQRKYLFRSARNTIALPESTIFACSRILGLLKKYNQSGTENRHQTVYIPLKRT